MRLRLKRDVPLPLYPTPTREKPPDRKISALRRRHQPGRLRKRKATARHAVSDWMEIEKERGISVTSSVLQFNYDGYCINILDTPGHQDFSEDTYRTLMAADSAVMVIDRFQGRGGPDPKAVKVCVMRHIPIFTFINKLDRDANDTFELLDDIEKELGIATCPINWPIGSGKNFRGVYDRDSRKVVTFTDTEKGTKEGVATEYDLDSPAAAGLYRAGRHGQTDGGDRTAGRSQRGV